MVWLSGVWLTDAKSDKNGRSRRNVAVVADQATVRVFTVDGCQQQIEVYSDFHYYHPVA